VHDAQDTHIMSIRMSLRETSRRCALLLALAVAIGGSVLAAPEDGSSAAASASTSTAPPPPPPPPPPTTTTTRTLSFEATPFTGISICTPVAVLVSETDDPGDAWTATIAGPADAVAALELSPTFPGSGSLAIESARPFSTGPSTPLRVEVRVPPRTLQYVERVHAPGDTWVAAAFSAEKAEVAIAAGAGVLLAPAMGAGMAKLSLAGPGPAVLAGSGAWWELFVTGGGVAHGAGATGSVRVKVGEGARLSLAPAHANTTVDGWVGPGGAFSMTQGVCYVKDETDGSEHEDKLYPCGGGGGGGAPGPPALVPRWACGVSTATPWRCGGGGARDGAPAFTAGPCTAGLVELAMAPLEK